MKKFLTTLTLTVAIVCAPLMTPVRAQWSAEIMTALRAIGYVTYSSTFVTWSKGFLYPVNTYLNFGGTASGYGTNGYGLRDSAGTMQFKDSGGSWNSFPSGGVGTVTSVSVTAANGVSGTVATPTTTPAITLILGAITPSSIKTSWEGLNPFGGFTGSPTTGAALDITSATINCLGLGTMNTPTSALAGIGAGNLTNGAYQWRLVAVDAAGMSIQSAASNATTIVDATANGQATITWTDLTSTAVTGYIVYRTKVGGSVYFRISGTLAANAVSFTDNVADTALLVSQVAPTLDGSQCQFATGGTARGGLYGANLSWGALAQQQLNAASAGMSTSLLASFMGASLSLIGSSASSQGKFVIGSVEDMTNAVPAGLNLPSRSDYFFVQRTGHSGAGTAPTNTPEGLVFYQTNGPMMLTGASGTPYNTGPYNGGTYIGSHDSLGCAVNGGWFCTGAAADSTNNPLTVTDANWPWSTTLNMAANGTITPLVGYVGGQHGFMMAYQSGAANTAWAPALLNGQPTIGSGFGSTPSIPTPSWPSSFTVNVGTGGTATSGVVTLPVATNGWSCSVQDITHPPIGVSQTVVTAITSNSVTLTNYLLATGLPTAWAASDSLMLTCFPR